MCVCAVKWVWHEAIKAVCFSGKSSGPTWQRFGVQSRFFGTTISQQTDPRWQWVGGERFKWRTVPGSCMLFQRVCCGFIHILNVSFCWILAPHLMPYIELFLMDLGLSRTQDKILEDEMIKNLPWIWHPALTSNPPCHPSLRFATGRESRKDPIGCFSLVCTIGFVIPCTIYNNIIRVSTMEVYHDKHVKHVHDHFNVHVVYLLGGSVSQAGTIFDLCQASICGEIIT